MKLKREQFLVGVTTTKGSDWRTRIKEVDELDLKKVAVFLTCLDKKQRQEFYDLLEDTNLKQIPFAHIKGEMSTDELDYLIKQWNTKIFNIHSQNEFPIENDYTNYKDKIYIENTVRFDKKELNDFAGICLDFSHLEDVRLLREERFNHDTAVLKKYPIGCNHISAIKKESHYDEKWNALAYGMHTFDELSEFDYLKSYPQKYFSDYIAIELENSLKDQLKVIDYILNL